MLDQTGAVQILTVDQQQLLEFIEACTVNGYEPTSKQVLDWAASPEPREARYERRLRRYPRPTASRGRSVDKMHVTAFKAIAASQAAAGIDTKRLLGRGFANLGARTFANPVGIARKTTDAVEAQYDTVLVAAAESSIEHMVRLGWLTERVDEEAGEGHESDGMRGLRLTGLGDALLANARRSQAEDEATVVSFAANSADVAYAKLIGVLSGHGTGMLLDRYLDLDGLARLHASTGIRRFVVGTQQKANRIEELRHYLYDKDDVEIRQHDGFHDRAFVFDTGKVFLLGASLNGLGGRAPTVLVDLTSDGAGAAIATTYKEFWDQAEKLQPEG